MRFFVYSRDIPISIEFYIFGDPQLFFLFYHDMSDPPDIRTAFIAGTAFFSSTAFITAGSYAIFCGHHQQFRYAFFTALNVGVAGGLFTGHPPIVLTLICRDTSMFTTSPRSFADSTTCGSRLCLCIGDISWLSWWNIQFN